MRVWLAALAMAAALTGAEWSKPVEIVVDDTICATYRARVDVNGMLLVRLTLADGWHTFAMDNGVRAAEKLAGKKALGVDKPTSITVTGGVTVDGLWMQPALKDFSKPELRIFSWGFEKQALFAAKVKRSGEPRAELRIQGQACTETICKNIDKTLELDLTGAAGEPEAEASQLTPIRTQ